MSATQQVVPYDDAYDDTYSRRSHPRSQGRNNELDYAPSSHRGSRRARSDRDDDDRSLPSAYYRDPADQPLRQRQRSLTPPTARKTQIKKGDIISAVAGAAAVTMADKFFVEPRMNRDGGNRGRSKSHHEALRRAADIGVGGIAGTAVYRAVSRSRARKKARSESRGPRSESRGRSEDSRDSRDDSKDRKRQRSQSIPWKSLVTTAGGALAGLAAERASSRHKEKKEESSRSRRRRDSYDDDSDDSYQSRKPRRSKSTRDDRSSRRDDRSDDDDYDDYDRRDRRRRRDRDRDRRNSDPRDQNPHHTRDLVQEAIGLLGAAQGLTGKNKGQAAVETAIGAYGLAQNYYSRHQAEKAKARP